MFLGFLMNLWISGSRLKHPVLAQMSNNAKKYLETLRKHQLNMFEAF